MWVKGSGSDLATMEREHFTPLRLDEMLAVFERDEMSDEDMVAHLARCQVDPAAPRSSIETLLHAFVPAEHVHHTHPDGINVLAGTRDGERAGRRVLRRRGGLDPVHPARASRSPSRSATAVRENPGLKLVVLAKHGLVVWGDTAEEAYRRTIEVINRAVDFVNAKHGRRRSGSAAPAGEAATERASARGAARAARRGLQRAAQGARRRHVAARARVRLLARGAGAGRRSAPPAPTTSCTPSALPLWIPFDPATEDAGDAARADPRARGRVPRRVPRLRRAPRRRQTEPADPDARVVLIQHVGLVGVGDDDQERRGCRATSTTARSR